jgi:DNA-binding response OmpR family regulator
MFKNERHAPARGQPIRKAVLIVEQDDGVASFLCTVVQEELSHYALLASNGLEALSLVQQVKVDLFLLSSKIAPINGIVLYDQLHSIAGLETVPAIILSTNLPRDKAEIEQRHLIGIDVPCELDALLNAIKFLLENSLENSCSQTLSFSEISA